MSDCTRSTDWLLEADLDVLRGVGDGADANHVRACARCAVIAERLVAGTERLAAALGAVPAPPDFGAIIARARMAAADGAADDASAAPSPGGRDDLGAARNRRRRWRRVATVAAAAVLAGLLLLGDRRPELPGIPSAPRIATALPTVEAASAANVAVIETDNPDITVVWLFSQ